MPEEGSKSNLKRGGVLTQSGPMGGLPGGGRTPKALQLKNYEKALNLLDNNIEKALNVLINGLESTMINDRGQEIPDKYYRFNCACVLIKKVLPDKKSKEISTPNNKPLSLEIVDRRKIIHDIARELDEMDFDELKRESEKGTFKLMKDTDYYFEDEQEPNGSQGITGTEPGGETKAEGEMAEGTAVDQGREGSGQDQAERESAESSVSAEEGF